eukprot:1188816-Prorocentrum_minimum.AAC.1
MIDRSHVGMPFRVNFMGTVNTIQAAYASVTRQPGGRIVLVSSQAGQVGIFGYTGYSASKFALRGLAEALQVPVPPHLPRTPVQLDRTPDPTTRADASQTPGGRASITLSDTLRASPQSSPLNTLDTLSGRCSPLNELRELRRARLPKPGGTRTLTRRHALSDPLCGPWQAAYRPLDSHRAAWTLVAPRPFIVSAELACAVQMEVRAAGVAVTVAYPPDTDTPQLQKEVKAPPTPSGQWRRDTQTLPANGGATHKPYRPMGRRPPHLRLPPVTYRPYLKRHAAAQRRSSRP